MNYYEVLGVGHNAPQDELKRAYRKLARRCHPDKNPDDPDAEARFKEIAEAYRVLANPQTRRVHDGQFQSIESVWDLLSRDPVGKRTVQLLSPLPPKAERRGTDAFTTLKVSSDVWLHGGSIDITFDDQDGPRSVGVHLPGYEQRRHASFLLVHGAGEAGANGASRGDLVVFLIQANAE